MIANLFTVAKSWRSEILILVFGFFFAVFAGCVFSGATVLTNTNTTTNQQQPPVCVSGSYLIRDSQGVYRCVSTGRN